MSIEYFVDGVQYNETGTISTFYNGTHFTETVETIEPVTITNRLSLGIFRSPLFYSLLYNR